MNRKALNKFSALILCIALMILILFFNNFAQETLVTVFVDVFDTLLEARVFTECWRREYNRYRPQSSLGYKSPAPEVPEAKNLTMKVVH
jgi:hypothetical protein